MLIYSSQVMNAYMYHLVQKYNKHSTKKAVCIDSYEMSNIWQYKRARVKVRTQLFAICNTNVINTSFKFFSGVHTEINRDPHSSRFSQIGLFHLSLRGHKKYV